MNTPTITWTKNGETGMASDGSMIRLSSWGAYVAFDPDDRYLGRFEKREDAIAAVVTR